MVHPFKTSCCLGYMDLRTGAIVWGHVNLVFNLIAVLSCLMLVTAVNPKYYPLFLTRPDLALLLNRMYTKRMQCSKQFKYKQKFNFSNCIFTMFFLVMNHHISASSMRAHYLLGRYFQCK